MSTSTAPTRQRSGGRSERIRTAVGDAVLALLTEGRVDFTAVEVAERADVSRRTLYRWWPTHEALLGEALDRHSHAVAVPDTGSWPEDVRQFAHDVAAFAAAPVDLAMARLMASGRHPGFGDAVSEHFGEAMSSWDAMVVRAVERGEAHGRHAPRTVVNVLVAPLFLAPLSTGRPAPAASIDHVVDLVLDATRASVRGESQSVPQVAGAELPDSA